MVRAISRAGSGADDQRRDGLHRQVRAPSLLVSGHVTDRTRRCWPVAKSSGPSFVLGPAWRAPKGQRLPESTVIGAYRPTSAPRPRRRQVRTHRSVEPSGANEEPSAQPPHTREVAGSKPAAPITPTPSPTPTAPGAIAGSAFSTSSELPARVSTASWR